MTQDDTRDRRFASTLAKGLGVMQAFKPADGALGNREIARRTGLPPSTVARMTFTLTSLGFLEQVAPSDSYRLGPAVMALGYTARAGLSFLPMAEATMQRLADDAGALVALAMRSGTSVMLTRCWHPRDTSSLWLREGHRLPMDNSAAGRAILAADQLGAGTRGADAQALEHHGFVTSFGDWREGVNACAVPFRDGPGAHAFAFMCGANASDLEADAILTSVGPGLRDSVHQLGRSIGLG
ncbi:MAG: IclR family transcriptional regulator [Marinibacterium sp.]|nr:IclR family transcriptional regulator [Marinibacterium sp.]